jgi:hypothetical protein
MVLKGILKYLIGVPHLAIYYGPSVQPNKLITFNDAYNLDDRKSWLSYVFVLNGGPISWGSRKQCYIASNTIKVEYITTYVATKEIIWTEQLLQTIGYPQHDLIPLFSNI